MYDIIKLDIPFIGGIYIQRDTITLKRIEWEVLDNPYGQEYLLCLGTVRVYLTPTKSLALSD